MKDSGIEWIGNIPEDWKTIKIKTVAKITTGNTPSKNDDSYYCENGLPWVKPENLVGFNGITNTKEKLNEDGKLLARVVPKNTLLICCIGSIGKFGYTTEEVAFNQQINAIEFNKEKIYWKYGIYYMSTQQEQQKYYQNGNVVYILNTENQKKVMLPYPSLQEQQKIADYLDEKVSEIDNIITQTTQSIEEYKKYKYGLITKCVTHGLDKNASMRKTNVDWIDEIPDAWDIKKLKYIFSVKKDIAGREGFDILSVTQSGLKIKDISTNEGQISADYSKYQIVHIGDFVMNHMDLLTGWVDCSKYDGVTSPDYRVFKFKTSDAYSSQYYTYIMQICYSNRIFYGLGQGVSNLGRWRLQTEKFINFMLPVPPKEEQQQIADYLDEKCADIDNLMKQKEQLLTELESYKKSLVYECVTGKREVK